jgi:hypothetical protein
MGTKNLNKQDGFQANVTVSAGTTEVTFLVNGGPARCEVYNVVGGNLTLVDSKTVASPGNIAKIGPVVAATNIRIQISSTSNDPKIQAQTNATVSF